MLLCLEKKITFGWSLLHFDQLPWVSISFECRVTHTMLVISLSFNWHDFCQGVSSSKHQITGETFKKKKSPFSQRNTSIAKHLKFQENHNFSSVFPQVFLSRTSPIYYWLCSISEMTNWISLQNVWCSSCFDVDRKLAADKYWHGKVSIKNLHI